MLLYYHLMRHQIDMLLYYQLVNKELFVFVLQHDRLERSVCGGNLAKAGDIFVP